MIFKLSDKLMWPTWLSFNSHLHRISFVKVQVSVHSLQYFCLLHSACSSNDMTLVGTYNSLLHLPISQELIQALLLPISLQHWTALMMRLYSSSTVLVGIALPRVPKSLDQSHFHNLANWAKFGIVLVCFLCFFAEVETFPSAEQLFQQPSVEHRLNRTDQQLACGQHYQPLLFKEPSLF